MYVVQVPVRTGSTRACTGTVCTTVPVHRYRPVPVPVLLKLKNVLRTLLYTTYM